MKFLLCSQNFSPELTGVGKYSGEMAAWLAARGHDVRVVTSVPYYPEWRVSDGYSASRYRTEVLDGARVVRCPIWVPAKPSGLARLLHLASFAASSLPAMLAQVRWRPDVVMVVEPSFFCSPHALVTARLTGARSWLHIQDFEIDAAFDLGVLSGGRLRAWIGRIERWIMRRFDRVSTISEKMVERTVEKGVDASRVSLVPNWVDVRTIYPAGGSAPFKQSFGLSAGKVAVLYSGAMGRKQGLDLLVQAARQLVDRSHIQFVLCGEGGERQSLMALSAGLTNVTWLPLQPAARLNDLLNAADIHVLPQRDEAADLVMPSKLGGMFASGRPAIVMAGEATQLGKTIDGRGLRVPPGDVQSLIGAVLELTDDAAQRARLGAAARSFAVTHCERDGILGGLERELETLCGQRGVMD